MLNLVHKFSTVGSSAKAGNFQFFWLVWIEQVIIPVTTSEKNKLTKYALKDTQTWIQNETYVSS